MKFFKKKKIIERDDGAHYMYRWNLFECKWFSIKLHKIMLSDYDCLHDHPWPFISIILKGGYVEHRQIKKMREIVTDPNTGKKWSNIYDDVVTKRIYHPGNILYRPANSIHKLEIYQSAWTLVFTFKKTREWGFWTPKGWVHWRKYINSENACNT
jgi:hypothetical protein